MEDGAAVVRTRPDGATELRINGVFVMDDRETSSERLLARRALARLEQHAASHRPCRVLVGGLGLGFTVRELLADRRVEHVLVAEVEPTLVDWMRDGTLPGADLLPDPRLEVRVGNVRDAVAAAARRSYDLILLDVDNGPDSLVYDDNAVLYEAPFMQRCAERLKTGGELSIWSQADSGAVRAALGCAFTQVAAERVPVRLQAREETYWLLRGTYPRRS